GVDARVITPPPYHGPSPTATVAGARASADRFVLPTSTSAVLGDGLPGNGQGARVPIPALRTSQSGLTQTTSPHGGGGRARPSLVVTTTPSSGGARATVRLASFGT